MRLNLGDYMAHGPDQGAEEEGLKGWDTPLRERDDINGEPVDRRGFETLSRVTRVYHLYGVVNHIGGMGSGHYTAYVKCCGRWFCCNDERVYAISEEDVVSANAYLLFYERADVAAEELGLHDVYPAHGGKAVAIDPEEVKRRPWV